MWDTMSTATVPAPQGFGVRKGDAVLSKVGMKRRPGSAAMWVCKQRNNRLFSFVLVRHLVDHT
jgi:hypothetical protein